MLADADVVDSHVHVWDLGARPQPWIDPTSMPAIDRSFLPVELEQTLGESGVRSAVLVQVLNRIDETEELLHVARTSTLVAGVVGWVDLAAPDLDGALDRLAGGSGGAMLVGVRHQALAEVDPSAWLQRPEVLRGMRLLGSRELTCDLMLGRDQLAVAARVLAPLESVTFVLDHAGKPPIACGWASPEAQAWADDVAELAQLRHVRCKLSGLTIVAGPTWTVAHLRPFVEHVLEQFGPQRVLFGSDWPVSLRAGSYAATLSAARQLVAPLSAAERSAVLGCNARDVYRLGRPPSHDRPSEGTRDA